MAARALTVDLGSLAESVEARVASGEFHSANEVVIEGLLALEREEAREHAALKTKIADAISDPRPSLTQDEAFAELRVHIARRRAEA